MGNAFEHQRPTNSRFRERMDAIPAPTTQKKNPYPSYQMQRQMKIEGIKRKIIKQQMFLAFDSTRWAYPHFRSAPLNRRRRLWWWNDDKWQTQKWIFEHRNTCFLETPTPLSEPLGKNNNHSLPAKVRKTLFWRCVGPFRWIAFLLTSHRWVFEYVNHLHSKISICFRWKAFVIQYNERQRNVCRKKTNFRQPTEVQYVCVNSVLLFPVGIRHCSGVEVVLEVPIALRSS